MQVSLKYQVGWSREMHAVVSDVVTADKTVDVSYCYFPSPESGPIISGSVTASFVLRFGLDLDRVLTRTIPGIHAF